MFIPIVPYVKVLNQTVVHSDTVLNLKDLGDNIKVTSISDVDEFSFEKCLKKVLESNPGVTFNTIQYSKENKKIYFYTDSEISTKEWEESTIILRKPLSSPSSILEEIKKVLNMDDIKDDKCISLYDVYTLMKKKYAKFESMSRDYELERIILQKYNELNTSLRFSFDYKNKELKITFYYLHFEPKTIVFAKNNDDLYIKGGSFYDDILVYFGKEIMQKYDEFMKYEDYIKQNNYSIHAIIQDF